MAAPLSVPVLGPVPGLSMSGAIGILSAICDRPMATSCSEQRISLVG